jgi:hypothetical protein
VPGIYIIAGAARGHPREDAVAILVQGSCRVGQVWDKVLNSLAEAPDLRDSIGGLFLLSPREGSGSVKR